LASVGTFAAVAGAPGAGAEAVEGIAGGVVQAATSVSKLVVTATRKTDL